MKTIGLVGGMSWESTLEYYRIINQSLKERLGGFHSAKSSSIRWTLKRWKGGSAGRNGRS